MFDYNLKEDHEAISKRTACGPHRSGEGAPDRYEEMITGPRARTWSAQMPAYCFTELCPDPQYRPEKKK